MEEFKQKAEIFVCDCSSREHQIVFEYDMDDNLQLIPKKDHQTLINIFDYNIVKLEKYVDYLGDDPSRIFDLNEILNIVNN